MTMNHNINNTVSPGDRIFATLDCQGNRLASINGSCFDSLDAVRSALLQVAGRYEGMAIITVRNSSQGWRDVSALATMRRMPFTFQEPQATSPRAGAQYLIPWAS